MECEQAIREHILDAFPDHGFYGEETGRTQEDAEYLWLVDPIDGTDDERASVGGKRPGRLA